jgi:hypothetical protein
MSNLNIQEQTQALSSEENNLSLDNNSTNAKVFNEDEDVELTDTGLTGVAGGNNPGNNPPKPPKPPGGG